MAKTINDAHLSLAYRLGESSVPTNATELARRLEWFKEAINIVCGADTPLWFLKTYVTIPTVADRQDYSLASLTTPVRKIIQVKVDNYKYDEVPFDEVYERCEMPLSPVPILPAFIKRAFYYRFDSIYLIPIPSSAPSSVSVSSLTSSGTTATVTTTDAHGLQRGDYVVIAGAIPSGYNGTVMVESVPSSTTFTYTIATSLSSPATGTITYTQNNIKIWYYGEPTEPTSVSSSIVVPDRFMNLLVAYAEGRYWSYAHKRGKSADAFSEFESLQKNLMKENFRRMFGAI